MPSEESKQKKGSGLRERILKGIGAQGFNQAVQIFIRLAEVPLLLTFWGSQLYGEWLLLSIIPAYLSIGDGGFATAACREMAIRGGTGDKSGVQAIFQSTWLLLIGVSLAEGMLAFGFLQATPLKDWFGFSIMQGHEVKVVFLLLIGHVLVEFQGGLLNGGFWVTGRYPIGMYLIAGMQLLEFLCLAVAVVLGGGPVQAAWGFLAGRLLGTGMIWLGHHKACPWLQYGFSHASFVELRRLTVPAFESLAFPLGNALNIQGMRLVVGLTLGPAALAVFTSLRTLSRLAMQPGCIISRLIEPELALAFGNENTSLFQRLFARSCQLGFWGCLGICFLLAPGAYWIFTAWTGGKIAMHWTAYNILLSGLLINSIWYTALMVPYSTNRLGRIAIFYLLIYGITAFGLGYIWTARLGLSGAALALLLAEAAVAVVVIQTSLRMTRMNVVQWIKTVLRPPIDLLSNTGLEFWRRITTVAK